MKNRRPWETGTLDDVASPSSREIHYAKQESGTAHMSGKFVYKSTENHVLTREGISQALRKTLFEIPREQWAQTPGFHEEPQFWLHIHQGLLQASATLPEHCEALLNNPDMDPEGGEFRGIFEFSSQLVHHAHQHHHIEDSHFFPLFAQRFPALIHPLTLLDGDHRVLSEVLDDMEKAANLMRAELAEPSKSVHTWQKLTENMLAAATSLDTLFRRHISDEEEICIPIMLKMSQ